MRTNKEYIMEIEKILLNSEEASYKWNDKLTDIVMRYKNDISWADNIYMNIDLCVLYSRIIID